MVFVLIKIDGEGKQTHKPKEFEINLQCKGMEIAGVRPEEKRKLLENLIAKASRRQ